MRVVDLIRDMLQTAFMCRDETRQAAAVNAAKTGKSLFLMMVYGYRDRCFRRIVEERLANNPELLLEV